MNLEEVRWGIIGCGDVTEKKSGPALRQVEGSRVALVMRRDAEKAADYALRHFVPRWTTDADALIHDPEVNAVYVATPPGSHAEYAIKALQAGKPVYIEKPMATTAEECESILRVARQAGLPVFVAFYRRALPHFEAIRALLAEGALGTVLSVRLHLVTSGPPADPAAPGAWRWNPALAGGGLLWDLGSHQLDLMDWWFGPIAKVRGLSARRLGLAVEDAAAAALEFESGLTLSAHWCFAAQPQARQDVIEIFGTHGSIRATTFGPGNFALTRAGQKEIREFKLPDSIQHPLIEQIVGELRGLPGIQSPSTGTTAARTNRVIEEIALG
jgi:predicted dehydrogenase